MLGLQKMGGIAALIAAATYMVGIGLALTLLAPTLELELGEYLAFVAENQTLIYLWHLIIYLINAVVLVVLVQALYERLKVAAPALAQTATAFGLIWAGLVLASGMVIIQDLGVVVELYGKDPAQAATVQLALASVESGLGGGIELPGGLWVLLVSWAGMRAGSLPRALNYLGLLAGLAGILTTAPALKDLGAVFGLGCIVWFAGVGVVLLRSSPAARAPQPAFARSLL